MKLKLTLIIVLFITICCKNDESKKSFVLNGKIKGDSPDYIFLHYGRIKDSSLVRNNSFSFKGKVDFPINAQLVIRPVSTINKPFYLENKNIEMEISIEKKNYKKIDVNFIKIDSVEGTETSIMQSDFENFKRKHKSDIDWNIKLFEKLNKLIEKNTKHRYSGDLLAEVSRESVLRKEQLKILYKKLDTSKQAISSIESLRKILYPNMVVNIGNKIIDFTLPNKWGELIDTKNYRGSILLIDFWASWCAPCRKQNPELLKIYNEFKNYSFEILGVSIDIEKDKWLRAIEKDNLTWENVIDSKGIESEILVKYDAATSIPRNFLIDQNGNVIAKDISMLKLVKQLKQINKK